MKPLVLRVGVCPCAGRLALALFLAAGPASGQEPAPRCSPATLMKHVEYLASEALEGRRAGTRFETAPDEEPPSPQNAVPPDGDKVESVEIVHGDLTVRFRDNSRSPGTLSGLQSLFNTRHAPDFDAFDPDAPGASAGLNFEHIIAGHRSRRNRFTPRHGKYELYRLEDGSSAMLVRTREDSPWDVSSTLRYSLRAPHAIDFEFRCTPHTVKLFGPRRYAIFFFANYMNDVSEVPIHFLGVDGPDGKEKWIEADAPPGHPDWNQGGTYRHRDAGPIRYDEDHNFRLNSWSYDYPRFTRPFYYGRAGRDMVFILMFDRAYTSDDELRFSLFKFKLPESKRPAWDFQYVVRGMDEGRAYGFEARLVWKRWVSSEDCLAEYEHWVRERTER